MLERGQQIGEYVIEAELGGGGMARVYRAQHALLETHHAIKVLDPVVRANPEARRRFLDEAKLQAKHLDHPNIVKVTGIVTSSDAAALVMDLIDGPSLEAHLAAQKQPLPPSEIRALMLPVLAAVGHAHSKGVIHRDIKPANVLLARGADGGWVPKVADFGIAKVEAAEGSAKKSTHADARMGTLSYMSPEQLKQAKNVTPRSDVFSLGALLYEVATLKPAFVGESDFDVMEMIVRGRQQAPEVALPSLDPAIVAVIRRALALDPADRFASCEAFAAALSATTTKTDVNSTSTRGDGAANPAPAAHRRVGTAVVIVVAAASIAGTYFVMRGGDKQPMVAAAQPPTAPAQPEPQAQKPDAQPAPTARSTLTVEQAAAGSAAPTALEAVSAAPAAVSAAPPSEPPDYSKARWNELPRDYFDIASPPKPDDWVKLDALAARLLAAPYLGVTFYTYNSGAAYQRGESALPKSAKLKKYLEGKGIDARRVQASADSSWMDRGLTYVIVKQVQGAPMPAPAPIAAPTAPPPVPSGPPPDYAKARWTRLAADGFYVTVPPPPEDLAKLDVLAARLAADPDLGVHIAGSSSKREYDRNELSQPKAAKVKAYLVTKGIDARRIQAVGTGGWLPGGPAQAEITMMRIARK